MNKQRKQIIVAVDDDQGFLDDLSLLLGDDLELHTVNETRTAMQLILKIRPDCLLMDLNMHCHFGDDSEYEGLAFVEYLRRESSLKAIANIPVIIISASPEKSYAARGKQLGIIHIVSKPPDIKDLKLKINELTK